MSLEAAAQTLDPGALVALFRLDTGPVGGPIMFFCQARHNSGPVVFGGVQYVAVDVEFEGMTTSAVGTLPTPRMAMSNSNQVVQNLINTYGDLLGCELRRVRTFKRFLDGQPQADPGAFWGPDVFRIERKTDENPIFVQWELSAAIDQEGRMLPGRQALRDTCQWRYRRWNGSAFVYHNGSNACPYTGGAMFDDLGQPTNDPAKDKCGQRRSDCKSRYETAPMPFGGFPGLARVRVR